MADNDTIRRIVAELDKEIAALQILERQLKITALTFAVARMQEARFWLKQIGHTGHFDTPEGDTP